MLADLKVFLWVPLLAYLSDCYLERLWEFDLGVDLATSMVILLEQRLVVWMVIGLVSQLESLMVI